MSHGRIKCYNILLTAAAAILFFCVPSTGFCQEEEVIPIPLYIDQIYSGEISVKILPDESVQIRPSELIAYLEELISEDALETAVKIFPESGWLDLTRMGGLGVHILFRFEDLTIHVDIPAHLRRETRVSLKGGAKKPVGQYVEQAGFSAFLNLELWNRFTYETLKYDFSATPELGLNIFDWVVEARGGVRTNSELFFLDYARLVKDFPSLGYRLEVGDLTIPAADIPDTARLLGASFRKNYNLINSSSRTAVHAKEIFIREPSKVEIYMNDRKISEKDYQSGSYIFQDFPLTRGINRISIRWQDSEGPHEENIIIPFDSSLLSAGEFDLGIAAGLPDRTIMLPAVTGYQYMGVTDKFTFGLNESFSIDSLELCIHPDFLLSTGFGNFNLAPVWGINFNGGQRVDAGLGYQMMRPGIEKYLNFGAGVRYKYDSISAPETPLSQLGIDGYFNFVFGGGFSLTPDLAWGYRFDESRHIFNGRAILKKSIRGGSALSANIGITYDNELSFSATISYSSSFPDSNQNLYLLENLETQRLSAFWNRYSRGDNDFSVNASAELPMNLDERFSAGISGGYQHPLFGINAGHDFDTIPEDSSMNNATYLSARSGLVYADGHLLLTKPVTDSFIIIVPGPEFAGQTIRVNPTSGGSDLEVPGKAGILPAVNSFRTHKIYVEPEELPLGMDDSEMKYLALPSYKSAFVIRPQAEIRIFAGGFIKHSDGRAVEAAFGSLTGKNTGESIDFFTDENGYFEAYNLPQDIFTMKLNASDSTVELDLSSAAGGFHDTGVISLPEE